MSSLLFCHQQSTTAEAIRFTVVALAMAIIGQLALTFLVRAEEDIKQWIQMVIMAVCALLLVFFVLPNIRQKGTFHYSISHRQIRCRFPDGKGYEVALSNISKVKKIRLFTSSTRVEYLVVEKNGATHNIPSSYGLSPHKVLSVLKQAVPGLEIESKTNY